VDVDGDGLFDDDAYMQIYGVGRHAFLTDDLELWFIVGLYDGNGDDLGSAIVRMQVPLPSACAADVTGASSGLPDGQVNVFDLFILLSGWATDGPGANLAPPLDIVDEFDLFNMLDAWGLCE
jgi:hypothetical protein